MSLVACKSCKRHARTTEKQCPFCGAEMPKAAPPRVTPAGKFGRAALVVASTAGIAAATDLAGCSDHVIGAGDAYGMPDVTIDHPTTDGPLDSPPDQIVAGDAYGIPADAFPPPDSGGEGGDGSSGDAGDGGG